MGQPAFSIAVNFESLTCCSCGIIFGVPSWWEIKRREDHAWFYCPNGHQQHFIAKSSYEAEKENHQRTLSRLNEIAAERDALARKVKRVERGVCPQCNRTFSNLQRHMACKHK